MAYEWGPKHVESYAAGVDLSSNQFYIGVRGTDGLVRLSTSAGAGGTGIIDFTRPAAAGMTVGLVDDATYKVKLNGTVAIGDRLTNDATGQTVKAAAGNIAFGTAREAGVAGQIIAARVDFSGAETV